MEHIIHRCSPSNIIPLQERSLLEKNGKLGYLDSDLFEQSVRIEEAIPAFLVVEDTNLAVFYKTKDDCPVFAVECPADVDDDCEKCSIAQFSKDCPKGKKPAEGLVVVTECEVVFIYN